MNILWRIVHTILLAFISITFAPLFLTMVSGLIMQFLLLFALLVANLISFYFCFKIKKD